MYDGDPWNCFSLTSRPQLLKPFPAEILSENGVCDGLMIYCDEPPDSGNHAIISVP